MSRKILSHKPLVEAIFELRWELDETKEGMKIDPHYKILIGGLYEKIKSEYSFHQQLPSAFIPDEIAGYVVQHRFRKDKDKWPLIQIGPGIITLNDTEGYIWEDFENRIRSLLDTLFDVYPDSDTNLKVNGLLLRYIDAIDFDYEKENIFDFMRDNLKVSIDIHADLFEDTQVSKLPLGLDLKFSFPSEAPKGAVHLRFIRGKKDEKDVLIWETHVQSIGNDAPKTKEKIIEWVNSAHELTDNWFFKMINGKLLRRFE